MKATLAHAPSLRRQLVALWLVIIVVAVVLGALMIALHGQGMDRQLRHAQAQALTSCEGLLSTWRQAYRLKMVDLRGAGAAPDPRAPQPGPLDAVVDLALRDQPGVEGGLWLADRGVIAYAFPTYDGSGVKRDVPPTELPKIEAIAARADAGRMAVSDVRPGLREALVVAGCADRSADTANSDDASLAPVAWTLQRVATVASHQIDQLVLALALLFGFVVASGGWLGWTLTRWGRGLSSLERALQAAPSQGSALIAQRTGLAELDSIGNALNSYAQRYRLAQEEREKLVAALTRNERLVALGRLSAGLAHEIRNPLATMRLKAENALAAPSDVGPARARRALDVVLVQTARLEDLISSLLAMTQPFDIKRQPVNLAVWLAEQTNLHLEAAERRGLRLLLDVDHALVNRPPVAAFDPEALARAVDNLLINALAHTPAGGRVIVTAMLAKASGAEFVLKLRVADDGPGVPQALRERLFEPFTTGRPEGTGLGLALTREIVEAHGGKVSLLAATEDEPGARFEVRLPWPAS